VSSPRLRLLAGVLGPVLVLGVLAPAASAQESGGGPLSGVGELLAPPPTSTAPAPAPIPAPAPKPPALPPAGDSDTTPGPGRSWTLTASALKLVGSRYRGVVERDGVRTLHFTVDRLEITDLVQRGDLGNGKILRTAARSGSVSRVVNGPIELYTQELTGTLAIARTTLTAESLAMPDLDLGFLQLPELTFTDAVVRNTDLAGGALTIPGGRVSVE
jgi:hypothetical protein